MPREGMAHTKLAAPFPVVISQTGRQVIPDWKKVGDPQNTRSGSRGLNCCTNHQQFVMWAWAHHFPSWWLTFLPFYLHSYWEFIQCSEQASSDVALQHVLASANPAPWELLQTAAWDLPSKTAVSKVWDCYHVFMWIWRSSLEYTDQSKFFVVSNGT